MILISAALGVIAVALVAIVVLLIIFLVRKKPAPPPAPVREDRPAPPPPPPTAFAGEYTIQLSDIRHPGQKWKLSVTDEAVIGRETDCALVLTDARVSRHHCRISVGQGGLLVTNLSETNETKHNGLRITGSDPLNAGDVLKLGHDELRVDFIQALGEPLHSSPGPRTDPKKHLTSDDTRHFF